MNIAQLLPLVRDCAFEVRKHLAPGYLESVYRKALAIELRSKGLDVVEEMSINVSYKGYNVGDFRADIVVDNQVIVELKAVKELTRNHSIQLVNYLTATGLDHGFLINYGDEDYRIIHRTRIYDKNYSY